MCARNHIPLCTIAGSDPTGGAGLQGDLKTFAAHGVEGTAVVTALTVQGRTGVRRVEPVPADLVRQQLEVVLEEVRPAAIKTGMLWSGETIAAVADVLQAAFDGPLVVDPVLVATTGGELLRPDALEALRERLVPRAWVITPNLPEAARLLGRDAVPEEGMEDAARALLALGCRAVVVKGGHGHGTEAVDVLATPEGSLRLALPRLPGANAHGTGCAFAASLAARLGRGAPLLEAVRGAKAYVHRALAAAASRGAGASLVHAVEA
jgi:hydroxymethylpyrimidine/phosphomethylpyrimidine kinase